MLVGAMLGAMYAERAILVSGNEVAKMYYCLENYASVSQSLTPNQCLKYFK